MVVLPADCGTRESVPGGSKMSKIVCESILGNDARVEKYEAILRGGYKIG